jgi:hypothetical protein
MVTEAPLDVYQNNFGLTAFALFHGKEICGVRSARLYG